MLFDGVCNLCNGSVAWLIARDPRGKLRFAALQSAAAARRLADAGLTNATLDTMVLFDDKGVHTRSSAVIRIAMHLGFPWSMAAVGLVLPRALRDWLYERFANNRYRWFGRTEQCMMPTAGVRARFVEDFAKEATIVATDR